MFFLNARVPKIQKMNNECQMLRHLAKTTHGEVYIQVQIKGFSEERNFNVLKSSFEGKKSLLKWNKTGKNASSLRAG
jgi:hypothetical protein